MNLIHLNDFNCKTVRYGFFGRQGGISTGLFSSLNCAPGSGDSAACVAENRRRVAVYFDQVSEKLLTPYQIHSSRAVYVDAPFDKRPEADALVTDRKGLVLSVLTADCAPVLFRAVKTDGKPIIAAAHAGHAGAFKGIIDETLRAMALHGMVRESCIAVIGPCIAQNSYEVGDEFRERFIAQDKRLEILFKPSVNIGHWQFNLSGYIGVQLGLNKVPRFIHSDIDTYGEPDSFFSYRRATHAGDVDYGRQISAIMIA